MIRQEKLNVNTTVELITQNSYDRQQNQPTTTPAAPPKKTKLNKNQSKESKRDKTEKIL